MYMCGLSNPASVSVTYAGRAISYSEILYDVKPTETLLCAITQLNSSADIPCPWRRGVQREALCNHSLSTFSEKQPIASAGTTRNFKLVFSETVTSGVYECGTSSTFLVFYIINGKST